MIYAALYLLVLLFVLDRSHSLFVTTKVFRSQCRLFEIRDHLREGVMNGEVDPAHWVFQYLDSTIVKTIDALGRLTIWRLVGVALADRDEKTLKALTLLYDEMNKPGNEYVRRVYVMYQAVLTIHLIDRSATMKTAIKCLLGLADLRSYVGKQFQKVARITAAASETSTLDEFAPA
jgi:hypothetical protein